jgi:hypothetical protein
MARQASSRVAGRGIFDAPTQLICKCECADQCRKWGSQTATCSAPAAALTAAIAVSANSVLRPRISNALNSIGADVTPLSEA